MIYTVTFNPALDYTMHMDELRTGEINRSAKEEIYCGGKGINVSYVLNTLGHKSVAMGFVAGFVGGEIENSLTRSGIGCDFVTLESGCTRINVKLRYGSETDINGNGPDITESAVNDFLHKLDKLRTGDFLVIAGSVPGGLDKDIYARIAKTVQGKGVNIVADTTGDLLLKILEYKPFLIKPNLDELGELFNCTVNDAETAVFYASKLRDMGARNVLVSMAEKGSLLVDEQGRVHIKEAAKGKFVNSVGAGDSMVAGFLAGYIETGDYSYAHTLGSAAGSATAFSPWLADKMSIITLC
ncbi:MAG: 1-phosphofructokinase [Clostridia bacterium]|nr:1-phosphofructokinase [Clostridia bacterium]